MGLKDKKLVSLQEIEGAVSPLSGYRMRLMKGEDLAGFVILYVIHMLRYVRDGNPGKQLPEVCYRV